MPNLTGRRFLSSLVVAMLLAGSAGLGTAVTPPRAAAITCSVITKCYTLTIVYNGTGDVNVIATSGISCRLDGTVTVGTCSARYYAGTAIEIDTTVGMHTCVTLPSGALPCSTGKNEPSMMPAYNVNYTIIAAYERAILVTITKAGTGSGHVASDYPGIDCGTLCSEYQPGHTDDGLSEQPDAGSVFAGWSGGCTGTSSSCTFNATSAIGVTATFNQIPTPPPSATPKPTPTPTATPKPTGTPGATQTASPGSTPSPGASHTASPGSTPTPGAGQTASPTLAPGATPTSTAPGSSAVAPATEGPPPASGTEASADASSAAVSSADASSADASTGASTGASNAAGSGPTSGLGSPAGATGDGGVPIGVVAGLLVLGVVIVVGGMAFRSRVARPRT